MGDVVGGLEAEPVDPGDPVSGTDISGLYGTGGSYGAGLGRSYGTGLRRMGGLRTGPQR